MKKLLRVITVILVAVILIANHPLSVKAADKTVHQFFGEAEDNRNSIYYYDDVRGRLDILQRDYFQCNRYWNHIGAAPGTDAVSLQYMVTDTACTHAATVVGPYCNHYTGNYGGSQCMGFAKLMCKGIFGTDPWDADWSYGSIDNLYVGDYVRINSIPHSFVIERIHEDSVDVYECNWNARCQINTRNIPMSTLRNYRFTASDSGNYIRHCNRNRSDIPGSNLNPTNTPNPSVENHTVKIYINGRLCDTQIIQDGDCINLGAVEIKACDEWGYNRNCFIGCHYYDNPEGEPEGNYLPQNFNETPVTEDMTIYGFTYFFIYEYLDGEYYRSTIVRAGESFNDHDIISTYYNTERFDYFREHDFSGAYTNIPDGMFFDGWYLDPAYTISADEAKSFIPDKTGYKVYGRFIPKENGITDSDDDDSSPMYPNFSEFTAPEGCVYQFRLYNPNSGEHFYTGSQEETINLIDAGWNFEGSGFITPTVGIPIYRLYSAEHGDHFYTTNELERDALLADNWTLDGDTGIAFPSAPEETGRPMYRLYNPNAYPNGEAGAHHFTMSWEEVENLQAEGWQYEFIAWYSV